MFSSRKTSAPASGASPATLSKSLRFRSSATAYLNRTFGTATNNKIFTYSGWIKRGNLTASRAGVFTSTNGGGTTYFGIEFDVGNLYLYDSNASTSNPCLVTSQVFLDPSAWYHFVMAVDTTQATASNRIKLYVNGSQITSFSTTNYPPQNSNPYMNGTNANYIGYWGTFLPFDGYMTDVYFVDGQALTPSSFGTTNATTGQWSPGTYSGTYGTNGFHLTFANTTSTTTLGYDTSGNSNNWTTNNISLTAGSTYDSMNDVPVAYSATASNYAVMNPNDVYPTYVVLSNGNLTTTTSATNVGVRGTIAVSSGKWYYEASFNGTGTATIGIASSTWDETYVGSSTLSIGYLANGYIYSNGSAVQSGLATYTSGDTIGIAYDASAGSIQFYKNNTAIGTAVTGWSGYTVFPAIAGQTSSVINVNFGQQPFVYTPPSGYNALNTYNIPSGTVTTTGTFTGNSSTNGPFVYLNGIPTAMTINANAVTFGTNANKLSNGFQVTTSSSLYNLSGTNTYIVTSTGNVFKTANAQTNP